MGLRFRIALELPRRLLWQRPSEAERLAEQAFRPAVEEATSLIHRAVTLGTPVGATAIARGSIQSAVEVTRGRPIRTQGRVGSSLNYILPLEQGSRPHWAPIAPLKLWARRKFGNERIAYAVQHTIARVGTKGAFMFKNAREQKEAEVKRILARGLKAWADVMQRNL